MSVIRYGYGIAIPLLGNFLPVHQSQSPGILAMLKHKLPPQQEDNRQNKRIGLWLSSGLILIALASIGIVKFTPQGQELSQKGILNYFFTHQPEEPKSSAILPLVSRSPAQRVTQLQEIISTQKNSTDSYRARYLLAVYLLRQNKGEAALEYLRRLDKKYPLLAPHILLKTAQAYQQSDRQIEAQKTAKKLIKQYPDSPLVVDASFWLAQFPAQNLPQLSTKFSHHPLNQQLARKLLLTRPDDFELLMWLAKYSRDGDLNPIRDRLVLEYPSQLTTEDWEAIASGYWREGEHRKAADAYRFARLTPRNLYRTARGLHLNGNISDARRWYQKLITEFHDARETGLALQYLASISGGQEALIYLDIVIEKFSQRAPSALLAKAVIYDALKQPELATQARNKLLQDYPNSAATVDYRWKMAQKLAKEGNTNQAWQWIEPVLENNLNLDILPKATFWAGKWATQLGKQEEAKAAFAKTIAHAPQSYYAWRSALALGWNVGSFTNVSQLDFNLHFPPANSPLPVGSEVLQELFLLGQYRDAWTILQSEIIAPQELTVQEQFLEGLLLIRLGENSAGIKQIWDLARRERPQDRKEWQLLRKNPAYWYGLFPFPYHQAITQNSQQQEINPLLIVSVMRKESSFAPEVSSWAGAVGLMQILPNTATWVAQQIDLQDYTLTEPEDNITIGTWYLAHNHQRYNNNSLLAIASYNAGTGNVSSWKQKYSLKDPDLFVEQIPFPETKDYVEGVFSNYWNYLRLYNPEVREKVAAYVDRGNSIIKK